MHARNYTTHAQYEPRAGTHRLREKSLRFSLTRTLKREIQADFTYVHIRGEKYEVLNIIDTGTQYGDLVTVNSRSAEDIKKGLEIGWFYRNGMTCCFSADHEMCRDISR